MKEIKFESIMHGIKRAVIPRESVCGYRHTNTMGIHIYKRGKIGYIFASYDNTFSKFDYSTAKYVDVSYAEFHKFLEIKVIKEETRTC